MNEHWDLAHWLDFLEHRHQQEIHLRLINPQQVAEILDVLEWSIPVITIGGTNGKGSTVAALSAIYQAAGYRVGQFTSPHLFRFNERICINQAPISDDKLCELFQRVELARGAIALSYFEMSFLAALLYFKESKLEVLILEVGMGGRLDATNIIASQVAIITTVDLDHQDYLGADREAIGQEKSEILRENCPFIYADYSPPTTVMTKAQALHTKMHGLGEQYDYQLIDDQIHIQTSFQVDTLILPRPNLHPKAAAAAVITSLCLQSVLPVAALALERGMETMTIQGRQQWRMGDISFLYDVAHNPQAAVALAERLQLDAPRGKVHAVFSALKDKDICGLIKPLSSIVDQWYPACLQSKRASTQGQLLLAFDKILGMQPFCFENPIQATQAALSAANSGDLIVVYGSFVLIAAVMDNIEG